MRKGICEGVQLICPVFDNEVIIRGTCVSYHHQLEQLFETLLGFASLTDLDESKQMNGTRSNIRSFDGFYGLS